MSSVSKKSENSEKPKLSRLSACKCGCMQRCELYVSHQLSPHSAKPTAFPLSQVRAPIDVGAKARKKCGAAGARSSWRKGSSCAALLAFMIMTHLATEVALSPLSEPQDIAEMLDIACMDMLSHPMSGLPYHHLPRCSQL